jgi:hypothetical protein
MPESTFKTSIRGYQIGFGWTRSGFDTNGVKFKLDVPLQSSFNTFIATATGARNPRWKSQIRLGQNATTSFLGVDYDLDDHWVTGEIDQLYVDGITQRVGYTNVVGGGYLNIFPPTLGDPASIAASVDNRAKRKFLDRYQSIKSSIEAGQDFGELKETLESCLHPLNSLKKGMVDYLTALKKRRKFRLPPKRLKKILSDTYLEFHFGWMPLADDVANLIADAGRTRFSVYPISASASMPYSGASGIRSFALGGLPSVYQRFQTTDWYSVRYKGAVRSRSANGQISWDQALRLTPENWFPTAWDLLPYSWIADYFVNVGDILQGLSFINSDLVWGCKTTRTESVNKFVDLVYQNPPPVSNGVTNYLVNTQTIQGGNARAAVRNVSRGSFSGDSLVPTLEFKVPTSKYPFLNVGALLLQRSRPLVPFFT